MSKIPDSTVATASQSIRPDTRVGKRRSHQSFVIFDGTF